jgi:putative CocE/NonD family hydrolase
MRHVADSDAAAVTVREEWIPLADGCRLHARIWLPERLDEPVPALLEYLPYRKGDWTAARDAQRHPWYAAHGYAAVRVDMRGSGNSDGILHDEYLPQEQLDAVEVIGWLAEQEWCSGAVGMFGISWGGFNALQVAARRPPALKAVVTVCSTDDRYANDVHYLGGCVIGLDMPAWAATMFAFNARPPDPAVVGGRWRELWFERLDANRPFIETWLAHQRRDDYWRQGSVCEDYASIEIPVYAVGGWADPYRGTVLRLLDGLSCPRKGLIGPWPHRYPDQRYGPGPQIDFLAETRRWWDHWLRGDETGVMDGPMLRVWMQESAPPATWYPTRPGRWVGEPSWPSPRIESRTLYLGEAKLRANPGQPEQLAIRGSEAAGLDGGRFFPIGNRTDLPPDQRAEDGLSLCFDSGPLREPIEILGVPEVALRIAADRPLALVAARLCDVAPAGESLLVTRGLLNLTHRAGHDEPEPLVPGEPVDVRIPLDAIAHSFPAGHRIRLALSPTYWPWAWPSPERVTLTVETGAASRLELSVRPPQPDDVSAEPPGAVEPEPPPAAAARTGERSVRRDVATGRIELSVDPGYGAGDLRLPDGLAYREQAVEEYAIVEGDPLSAGAVCRWTIELGRGDWQTRIETRSEVTADAISFRTTNELEAFEGETSVFSRTWSAEIPRDHV